MQISYTVFPEKHGKYTEELLRMRKLQELKNCWLWKCMYDPTVSLMTRKQNTNNILWGAY